MKKQTRKLALTTETVAKLGHEQLTLVNGAGDQSGVARSYGAVACTVASKDGCGR